MNKRMSYKTSGVDMGKANRFVDGIQAAVKSTFTTAVLKRKGSFGALFAFGPSQKYRQPVLVSSTDGVGTKLLIAQAVNKHDTVGIDLVAMNVNDILCVGAKPLFFLDYIACGKLRVSVLQDVVNGIAQGCRQAGCSLIGGETAEMPGMYKRDEYDLAGFAVGVVEKRNLITGRAIRPGDKLLGVASNGLHSNGFSLVRRVFSTQQQKKRAADLLRPTKIYVREVLAVLEKFSVHGIAHLTGGAFYEKLTRILPKGLCFVIREGSWPVPSIFNDIEKKGKIAHQEMLRTFNMGIGLVLVVAPADVDGICRLLKKQGSTVYQIGDVVKDRTKRIAFIRVAAMV